MRFTPLLYLLDGSYCIGKATRKGIKVSSISTSSAFVHPSINFSTSQAHLATTTSSIHATAIDANTMPSNAYKMLINGLMVDSTESYGVINPATGKEFARAPHASKDQATE